MWRLSSDADTIAAIATPPGVGGIGIVRLSGGDALAIAERLFRPSREGRFPPKRSHTLTHGHLVDPKTGETVDEVLVATFRAPHTYTGEELVEIHAHGGPLVLQTILRLLCENGARLANPGEFTQRAFLNGRLDLAQAEAVADIIHAKTEASLRAATAQLGGSLSQKIREVRDLLIDVLAETEARIDFPDEELDFVPTDDLERKVSDAKAALRSLLEGAKLGRILREGVDVVIVGKPNVGKSSLLNALLDEERAIVTELPGTTRDVIEEYVNLRGFPIRLSDTAGIHKTEDRVEREGVARSHRRAEEADVLLVVLDLSNPLESEDEAVLERTADRPRLLVLNKCDRPHAWDVGLLDRLVPTETPRVVVSATERRHLDRLIDALLAVATGADRPPSVPPTVTNLRHERALREALDALEHVERSFAAGASSELVAVDLRGALDALGLIVGETVTDDILDRIFSQFCIGK